MREERERKIEFPWKRVPEEDKAKGNEVRRYKMVRSDWVHRTGER